MREIRNGKILPPAILWRDVLARIIYLAMARENVYACRHRRGRSPRSVGSFVRGHYAGSSGLASRLARL